MAKHYTRRALRRPDEFITFWHRVYDWLSETAKPILIGLGVLAVIVVSASLYMRHRRTTSAGASHRLSRAIEMYRAELKGSPKAGEEGASDVPQFATPGQRTQAVVAELESIAAAYPGHPVAEQAVLVRAGVLLDAHRYDESIKAYGDFLARAPYTNAMRPLGREGKAYALEGAGKLDAALEELHKLAEESPLLRDQAHYSEARILEKKGEAGKATALYKALSSSAKSVLREDAASRLASMRAPLPSPPAAGP